jgi:hypothetical protein
MNGNTANFDTVRAIALKLPGVEESTIYGSPAFKMGKRLVACLAIHRSAEPGPLVVRTDFDQRAALLASARQCVIEHAQVPGKKTRPRKA